MPPTALPSNVIPLAAAVARRTAVLPKGLPPGTMVLAGPPPADPSPAFARMRRDAIRAGFIPPDDAA